MLVPKVGDLVYVNDTINKLVGHRWVKITPVMDGEVIGVFNHAIDRATYVNVHWFKLGVNTHHPLNDVTVFKPSPHEIDFNHRMKRRQYEPKDRFPNIFKSGSR